MRLKKSLYLLAGSLAMSWTTASAETSPALKLVEQSCLECHDEDIQKGDLRLDELYPVQNQPKSMYTWLKVYDKVKSGEMPPKKKAFSPEEKSHFLKTLERELSAFDDRRKETTGRVVMRRLSSTEYKHAVSDLLHLPHLSVKHYLPEDNQYHGIENVADRQQIAYNQIAQYLEAAEMSLQAAVTLKPRPRTYKNRYPATKLGASRKVFNNAYKIVGDKLVLIKEPELSQGPWGLFTSPSEPGYYKIRFKAHSAQLKNEAFQTQDKSVNASNLLPGKTTQSVALGISLGRYLDTFDLSPEAQVFESTVYLHGRERLSINCSDLPLRVSRYINNKKPKQWDGVALEWFEIEGPILSQWPSKSHEALFGKLPIKKWSAKTGLQKPRSISIGTGEKRYKSDHNYHVVSMQPERDSMKLLQTFMTRAYRRPVKQHEVKPMQARVLEALEQKVCFHDAMLIAYKAILSSPEFLYLQETPGKLDSLALATRLSLYLWRSIPDQQLIELALSNQLIQPEILKREAERMLQAPKATRFIDDFTDQWLNLEAIYATTPDKALYPEYHEQNLLVEYLVDETRAYTREMLNSNLPILNIVDSNFAFLNERLAKHYGIDHVKGSHIRKVTLPQDSIRGGILTQGSMMKITANGFTTSPIKRGIWVVERILGTPPPPPPPNAGAIEPDIRGAKTIRELLDKHREVESCASCHKLIDPPGFALESFDIMGAYRENYRSIKQGKKKVIHNGVIRYDVRESLPVDSRGEYGGKKFNNIDRFKFLISKDERQIARNMTYRLVTQATGATPTFSDRKVIEALLDKHQSQGFKLKSLVADIITTPMFLEK